MLQVSGPQESAIPNCGQHNLHGQGKNMISQPSPTKVMERSELEEYIVSNWKYLLDVSSPRRVSITLLSMIALALSLFQRWFL